MTESCGAATVMPADRIKAGLIGPAAPFNEVRLDPVTQELLVRGPNVFMGYLNLPEKPPRRLTPTAGCTPAMWARWTTKGFSGLPIG